MQHDLLTGVAEIDRRFFARLIDDNLVVIDMERMELRVLNPTAAALWLLVGEGTRTAAGLSDALTALFGAEASDVGGDVRRCLAEWGALGWIADDGGAGPVRLAGAAGPAAPRTGVTPAMPGDAPPEVPATVVRVRLSGADLAVELGQTADPGEPDLIPRLTGVLSGFPAAAGRPDTEAARLRFIVAGDRIWIGTAAGLVWTADPSDALSHLVLHLFLAGYPRARILATVHAAALGAPDGLVVLPGLSGCGKSTLTAYLAARGWRYAGDDIVALGIVDDGPPVVLPFPTAVSVKPGSWTLLEPLYPRIATLAVTPYAGKAARFLPLPEDCHAGPGAAERTPRAIVFARFDPAASGEPVAMSTLDAVLELVACGFTTGERLDGDRLSRLFDFLEATPKVRLSFPTLEVAERCLSALLASA